MNRNHQFTSCLTAGVAVVALLLSGCGKEKDQAVTVTGGARGLSAAASATAGESYSFEMVTTVELPDGDEQSSRADGQSDGVRSSMTMEIPLPGVEVSMDIVNDGDRQFLRYNGMPAASPLPKGWIELENAGNAGAVLSTTSVDTFLERFTAKGAKVEDEGTVRRDGADYHRYTTKLDLSSSYEITTTNRVLERLISAAAKSSSDIDATIDVDEDGRIARIVSENDSLAGHATSTVTLSDFGKPVTIDLPEDAEAMSLDEFAALAYPAGASSDEIEDVDPSELIDRDEFVDLLGDQPNLTDELAECLYDELLATNPGVLREEIISGNDLPPDAVQAFTAAGMVCGATGG